MTGTATQTATSASLTAERAEATRQRAALDAERKGLALGRVSGDPAALDASVRLAAQIADLNEQIEVLGDAIEQVAQREAEARAAESEAATVSLEQQAEADDQVIGDEQATLAALVPQVRTLVKSLAARRSAYATLLHTIYARRGFDRGEISRLLVPHRMLGAEAAGMLSEDWLRQVLAEARHEVKESRK